MSEHFYYPTAFSNYLNDIKNFVKNIGKRNSEKT